LHGKNGNGTGGDAAATMMPGNEFFYRSPYHAVPRVEP
jgi:hypothetical protein